MVHFHQNVASVQPDSKKLAREPQQGKTKYSLASLPNFLTPYYKLYSNVYWNLRWMVTLCHAPIRAILRQIQQRLGNFRKIPDTTKPKYGLQKDMAEWPLWDRLR